MIYALTNQRVSLKDRKEIAEALRILKKHEDEGNISHALHKKKNRFCIYCGARVFSSPTKLVGRKRPYSFVHYNPADPPCRGSSHYLGIENPDNFTFKIEIG